MCRPTSDTTGRCPSWVKKEIVPLNSDFRSSLNSRHSPTRRSRPKNDKPGHHIALFDWVQAYHSDDFSRCNAGIRFVNSRLTFKTLTRKSRTASKKAPYAFGHGGNAREWTDDAGISAIRVFDHGIVRIQRAPGGEIGPHFAEMSIQQFRSGFHGNTSRLVVELFKLESIRDFMRPLSMLKPPAPKAATWRRPPAMAMFFRK
jgi:hypothetical protein